MDQQMVDALRKLRDELIDEQSKPDGVTVGELAGLVEELLNILVGDW